LYVPISAVELADEAVLEVEHEEQGSGVDGQSEWVARVQQLVLCVLAVDVVDEL
jgi:hypothetical protein